MQTDADQLLPYIVAGYSLLPLHHFTSVVKLKNGEIVKNGKRPIHNDWPRLNYDVQDQVQHMLAGNNVGVQLRDTDLVIDVDPRHFREGDDSWQRLKNHCNIDERICPTVLTGGGGMHLYFKIPHGCRVRGSLADFPGIQFKDSGEQVVAAGSVHPDTQLIYLWAADSPHVRDAPEAPLILTHLIKTALPIAATGGGEYDSTEISNILAALDPVDFRDHDKWLKLLMACHHASAGMARDEFIDWSTSDPTYADHGDRIGRRWDGMHGKIQEVTFRTLHYFLTEAGRTDAIPRTTAQEDFEDVNLNKLFADQNNAKEGGLPRTPLEQMNEKYCAVMSGGNFRIMYRELDYNTANVSKGVPARYAWFSTTFQDLQHFLNNQCIPTGEEGKYINLAKAWAGWPLRRTYSGVVFDPERDYPGQLNLWTGWGFEPSQQGSWDYLKDLIFECLCDGDERVYQYILKWCAFYVQKPSILPETAICFQGGKGVGKGTLGRTLARLAGRHGMHITSQHQITGRFNAHLRDTIFLFADEVVLAGDRQSEMMMNSLITEPFQVYEKKRENVFMSRNMLHIMMASNEEHFVSAGLERERRYLIQKCSNRWQGKFHKFKKLNDELENGGYAALLFDLMSYDLADWSPREAIPNTTSARHQKIRNMTVTQKWWVYVLEQDDFPFKYQYDNGEVFAFKQDVRNNFLNFCEKNNIKNVSDAGRSSDIILAREISSMCSGLNTRLRVRIPEDRVDLTGDVQGRARAYGFPSLQVCREIFNDYVGENVFED